MGDARADDQPAPWWNAPVLIKPVQKPQATEASSEDPPVTLPKIRDKDPISDVTERVLRGLISHREQMANPNWLYREPVGNSDTSSRIHIAESVVVTEWPCSNPSTGFSLPEPCRTWRSIRKLAILNSLYLSPTRVVLARNSSDRPDLIFRRNPDRSASLSGRWIYGITTPELDQMRVGYANSAVVLRPWAFEKIRIEPLIPGWDPERGSPLPQGNSPFISQSVEEQTFSPELGTPSSVKFTIVLTPWAADLFESSLINRGMSFQWIIHAGFSWVSPSAERVPFIDESSVDVEEFEALLPAHLTCLTRNRRREIVADETGDCAGYWRNTQLH